MCKYCIIIKRDKKYYATKSFHDIDSVIEILENLPSNTFVRIWKVKNCK